MNTSSQPLKNLKDFAPLTIVYVLCMKTNSEMKKSDQKGYQKKMHLTQLAYYLI